MFQLMQPQRRTAVIKTVLSFVLSGSLIALSATARAADSYPAGPVRIVVPFGPASGTDSATRVLAQRLEAALGQPVTVENRPGASGALATVAVAHAPADGLTLLMGTNSTHGANSGLMSKLGYDPIKDFVPICMVATFSSMLVVNASLPVKSVNELIAYAKARPNALSFAAGNTSSLIMGEMFARRTGIDWVRVPYTSNPAGLTDVIGDRVQVMFPDIASSQMHVKAGTLRALGTVTFGGRSPLAPDLPTVSEAGVPDFNFIGWIGLFAPAGTPEAAVRRIGDEMRKIVSAPDFSQRLLQLGAETRWMGTPEFQAYVADEVVRLPKLLKEIGVQPQ